jgi:putative ABC transport system permease protein
MEEAIHYANNFLEKLKLRFSILRMLDDVTTEVLNAIDYITYGFTAISTIALIVGGIVLMNTLLICVTERTKEIGILKALGAPSHSILLQFLCESLMICFMACLLGVFLAFILLSVLNQSIDTIINLISIAELQDFLRDSNMSFSITRNSVIVSVVFSICVGIIFGLYPAKKGADMQPIDALRYE